MRTSMRSSMRGRASKVSKPKRSSRTPSAVPESVNQGVDYLAAAAHAHQLSNHHHQQLHGDEEDEEDDDEGEQHQHPHQQHQAIHFTSTSFSYVLLITTVAICFLGAVQLVRAIDGNSAMNAAGFPLSWRPATRRSREAATH